MEKYNTSDKDDPKNQRLRQIAEKQASLMEVPDPSSLSPEDNIRIFHELQAHKIELEIQNEELRNTQEELEKSRVRYKKLYDFAPVGYVTLNEKGLIMECNLTVTTMLGINRMELINRPLSKFISPEHQGIYSLRRKALFETGRPQVCEILMLRQNNPPIWTQMEMTLGHDLKGNWVCLCGIIDINDRKEAEQKLQKINERLSVLHHIDRAILSAKSPESIVQAALDGLWKLVPCQRITVIQFDMKKNEALVLGSVVKGKSEVGKELRFPLTDIHLIDEFRHGKIRIYSDLLEYPKKKTQILNQLIAEGIRNVVNIPLMFKKEIIGTLNLGASVPGWFTDEHVAIAKEVAMQLAIALRQACLYDQLKQYSKELEYRVAQRTRQLEWANKMLEEFAYSVSHDLKTPLRAILGFTQIIARRYAKSLEKEARHYFENILEAATHMEELINDLLKYSKLGKNAISLIPVELSKLIEDVVSELANSGVTQGAEIIIDPDLPVVEGDVTLLRQIFINLIDNALKYRKKDTSHRVEIRAKRENKSALIEVRDNGIGIEPKYQEKIFNIFQRLHSQSAYPGTGIGLAIVKRAVHLMNGKVEIESTPGEGSIFRVKLKIARI